MAITLNDLTTGEEASAGAGSTSASISPSDNALVLIAVADFDTAGAPAAQTASGGGMTSWDQVATTSIVGTSGIDVRLTVLRAQEATPGTGTVSLSGDSDVDYRAWSIVEFESVTNDVAGNGAGAVVQSSSDTGSGASAAFATSTLAALDATENRIYAVGSGATSGTTGKSLDVVVVDAGEDQINAQNNGSNSYFADCWQNEDGGTDGEATQQGFLGGGQDDALVIAIEIEAAVAAPESDALRGMIGG